METRDQVSDALELLRGLVARPESLIAIKLHDTNDIVVIERGASSEGDLIAVRLLSEQRTALGRLRGGRWQPAHPHSSARNMRPGAMQVLGRVLSVIHPARPYAQPQVA
jgi:hypothetical protein